MAIGSTRFIVMIEDAEGLHNMNSIAAAHPRICGMIVGAEDLAVSLQSAVNADILYVPHVLAVAACRRAGLAPIGFLGSVAAVSAETDNGTPDCRENGCTTV